MTRTKRGRTGFLALVCLPGAWASSFPSPTTTPAPSSILRLKVPRETEGPDAQAYELRRRDPAYSNGYFTDLSAYNEGSGLSGGSAVGAATTVTSWVPASACGYVDGIFDNSHSIYCRSNAQCVFHTQYAEFPGLVGCCEKDDPSYCAFETTCYERDEIIATPSLTEYPNYMFAVLCTNPSSSLCRTWTYPELSLTDYGCLNSRASQTVYLEATPLTSAGDADPTVAAVSPSLVDNDFLRVYISGSAATAIRPGKATTTDSSTDAGAGPTGSTSSSRISDSSNKGSSTNVGAIAGGVVGGVLGLAGIVAAGVMFYLLKKKKKDNYTAAATTPPTFDEGYAPPKMQDPPISALSSPGVPFEVQGNSFQKYTEVDGYTAGQKFPSQAEVPNSSYIPHEMDASHRAGPTIAELPVPDRPPRYS